MLQLVMDPSDSEVVRAQEHIMIELCMATRRYWLPTGLLMLPTTLLAALPFIAVEPNGPLRILVETCIALKLAPVLLILYFVWMEARNGHVRAVNISHDAV